MSKIGSKVIAVVAPTTATVEGQTITVTGPLGVLVVVLPESLEIAYENNTISVTRKSEDSDVKALHGLFRSIVANAVHGVANAWKKRLQIVGTGFNVKQQGEDLLFKVGFSHQVTFKKAPGFKLIAESPTSIVVEGIDKQIVGQVAHQIKMIRKPDPYKGKGIRYEGEVIKTKVGKKAKA